MGSYSKSKGRKENIKYVGGRPEFIQRSTVYKTLKGNELKVFDVLISQYNGYNNGNLTFPQHKAKEYGLTEPTAIKGIKGLIEKGLIKKTTQGGRQKGIVSRYALTFYPIDECIDKQTGLSQHNEKPTTTASNEWRDYNKHLTDLRAKNKKI